MIVQKLPLRRRRLWLGLGFFVAFVVTLLGGFYALIRHASERELMLALAETDQLDPYWRLEDLEAHRRPMPPPGENGFEQVMAAIVVKPTLPWPQPSFPQFDNDRPYQLRVVEAMRKSLDRYDRLAPVLLNEEEARVLRAELERAKGSISILRRMVDFPFGRGPSIIPKPGSIAAVMPSYIKLLDAAKMLVPDARLRIYEGDTGAALHDVRAVLHISRALEEEPFLMAQLVRRAIDNTAINILQRALAGGIASEPELAAVQRELEHEAATPMLFLGFRGERAFRDHVLEKVQSGEISMSEFRAQVSPAFGKSIGPLGNPIAPLPDQMLEAARFILFCIRLPKERAKLLRSTNEMIAIGQLPPHERVQAMQVWRSRSQQQSSSNLALAELFFGGELIYNKHLDEEVVEDAKLSCAIIAVAAERFRLAKQRWPQNLEELTPTYLKALAPDPFSRQPLRFVRKGSAFIIYSVGPAQKDYAEILTTVTRGPDLGFVLHDPAQRRRPGPAFVFPERIDPDPKQTNPQPNQK